MGQLTITSGKILKGDKVEISFSKRDSADAQPAECNETHKDTPHPDLHAAFKALIPHAAIVGGFCTSKDVKKIDKPANEEELASFNVSSFSIQGEDESVIITAQKSTTYGSTGFNTPRIRFDSETYAFTKELVAAIELCKDEWVKYLNGKFAANPQQDLFKGQEKE
jgi:hypothetical protein